MGFDRIDFKEEKIKQVLEHSYVLLERHNKTNFSYFFQNVIPDAILNKVKRDTPLYFTCLPQKYLDEIKEFYIANAHAPIINYFLGLFEEFVTDRGRITQNSFRHYQKGSEYNDPYCNFKIAECLIRNNEKSYMSDILKYLFKSFLVTCIEFNQKEEISYLENSFINVDSFHYLTYYYDRNKEFFIITLKDFVNKEKFSTYFLDALLLIFESLYDINQIEKILNLLKQAMIAGDKQAEYFYCVISQFCENKFSNKFKLNEEEIISILDNLSNNGNFFASERLGLILNSREEYIKSFMCFSRAEIYLLPTSLRFIGNSYCSHRNILGSFDPVKAYDYWKKAYYMGTFGTIFIDYCQKNGDFERLKVLCELGVELNLYGAHYLLGKCYEKGRGVDKNFNIALSIYKSRFSNKKDLLFYSLYRIAKINEMQGNFNISNQLYKVVFLIHKWFYDQPQDNIEKSIANNYRLAIMLSKGKGVSCDRIKANLLLDEIYEKRLQTNNSIFISSLLFTKALLLKEKNLRLILTEKNNSGTVISMKNRNYSFVSQSNSDIGFNISENDNVAIFIENKEKGKRKKSKRFCRSFDEMNLNLDENKSPLSQSCDDFTDQNLSEEDLFNELDNCFENQDGKNKYMVKIKKDIHYLKKIVEFKRIEILKIDREILNNMNSKIYFGYAEDNKVTIKEYKFNNNNQLRKAIDELLIQSALNHQNINQIKYICIGIKPLKIISVNAYMGFNLRYMLKEIHLNIKAKLKLAIQILEAVNYLHSQDPPIVHCDLKPENILVDEESNIQICNFGLSKVIWNESLETDDIFTTRYSPPELIKNKITSKARDIWAIGLIFYEIFYGNHLFEEKSMNELIEFLMNFNEVEIKNNHFLSSDITNLIKRCLTFEYEKRPESRELLKEISNYSTILKDSQNFKFY